MYYPIPNHRLARVRRRRLDLPETERAADEVLSLPVHPSLSAGRPRAHRRGGQRASPEAGRLRARPLRAGLLGLGMMGRHHARVLRELDGRRPRRRRRPGRRSARRRRRPGRSLPRRRRADRRTGIDCAVVAVPTVLPRGGRPGPGRRRRAHPGREADRHSTPRPAERLAEAFAAAGLVGAVGHIERFNPALQRAAASGSQQATLGEVYQIATRRQGPFPARIADVGVVKDLATHDIDLTAWVAQLELRVGRRARHHTSGREHEDMIVAVRAPGQRRHRQPPRQLALPDQGARASSPASGARSSPTRSTGDLTFYANGTIATEWDSVATFRGVSEGDVTRFAIEKREPLRVEQAIPRRDPGRGSADIVTMADGVTSLRVIEACLRSAAEGVEVRLSGW